MGERELAKAAQDFQVHINRRTAGTSYDRQFQTIVKAVDDFGDANKVLQRDVSKALQDIKKQLSRDVFFHSEDLTPRPGAMSPGQGRGDRQYGFDQQVEYMEKALKEAEEAASSLDWAYDEFNRWALKWMK